MTATSVVPYLDGTVRGGWEDVVDAFAVGFAEGRELGAALCVVVDGRPVVDVWGGVRDGATGQPWTRDTLVPLTSVTKSVLATVVHQLVRAGAVDLDRPVGDYWPAFRSAGRQEITARMMLAHQAGLPAFPRPVTLADQIERTPVIEMIEGMTPRWRPGTAHGYHAITLGFLMTEVMRRVTGGTERPLLRELLTGPLGLDLHLGVPPDEIGRIARMGEPVPDEEADITPDPALDAYRAAVRDPRSLMCQATFHSTAMSVTDMNDPRYATMERPSGGYATATAVATMFAGLIGPVGGREPLLDPAGLRQARRRQAYGPDQVFQMDTSWGLGYLLPGSPLWRGAGPRAFGHIGSSGALAYADPDQGVGFAYLPNQVKSVLECTDRRAHRLMAAVTDCLGRQRRDGGE